MDTTHRDRPPSTDAHASSVADELFAVHLVHSPSSDEEEFRTLCAEHPELGDELAELREGWLKVTGVLRAPASRDIVLPVNLPSGSESGPPKFAVESSEGEFTAEMLTRLERRADSFRRYRHVSSIAKGAQGIVSHVWEEDLRRHLAMKQLLHESSPLGDLGNGGVGVGSNGHNGVGRDREAQRETRRLSRFLEEAQVTSQLGHPGVPPVHELGLDDRGRPFFTMPLVRGQTLAEVFEAYHEGREAWSLARLLGIFLKVCEAVGYAHSKGVIHRDLKPSNVMVGKYGETYVMDWGLAHVIGRGHQPDVRLRDLPLDPGEWIESDREDARRGSSASPLFTMDGDVVGTPAYMSPEQARGSIVELSERSDVYAIGAMLYHLLTGQAPYTKVGARTAAREVVAQLLIGEPTPLNDLAPELPGELVAICEKAMAYKFEERYTSAAKLADDLHAYLDTRPVQAHAPGLWHTLKLSIRRNRRLAGAISIAASVLLVSSILFVARLSASEETSSRRADLNAGPALLERELQLYPALPAMQRPMERWLADSADLLSRRAEYEAQHAISADELERAQLAGLFIEMDELAARRPGVERRLAFAGGVERQSLDEPAEDWRAAIAAIAGSDVYEGLQLEPQLGLVPLGENPHSGLWEFWHIASGERPTLDESHAEYGAWGMKPSTGIVLVLVPGGEFTLGAPMDEEYRRPGSERQHTTSVPAYFLSKYELTQGQYCAVIELNPSSRQASRPTPPVTYDDRHPVESIEWADALLAAERLDLVLPTEAQWERAARAETTTAYYWGSEPEGAEGYENFGDLAAKKRFGGSGWVDWNDGHSFHAPVGTYLPNPWGFHDLQGNVSEWCVDEYRKVIVDEDGERVPPDAVPHRVWARSRRGIHFQDRPREARTALRHGDSPRGGNVTHGARLAREVR